MAWMPTRSRNFKPTCGAPPSLRIALLQVLCPGSCTPLNWAIDSVARNTGRRSKTIPLDGQSTGREDGLEINSHGLARNLVESRPSVHGRSTSRLSLGRYRTQFCQQTYSYILY